MGLLFWLRTPVQTHITINQVSCVHSQHLLSPPGTDSRAPAQAQVDNLMAKADHEQEVAERRAAEEAHAKVCAACLP
jgi:hypothetical protein